MIDPRLRTAVDASHAWYDALCALHRVPVALRDGLWWALGPPPPLHSAVKTIEPSVPVERILQVVAPDGPTGVADSFADLDLTGHGFAVLFDARWIHRAPPHTGPVPPGWSMVTDPAGLAAWTARHDTTGVLLPGLLGLSSFAVMAREADAGISAGAVLQLGTGAVHVSNVWADGELDWADLVRLAAHWAPGRALVGYESDGPLAAALAAGFADVGPQRVWVR